MALFLVVALADSAAAIDAAVQANYADSSFHIEPGKWVVKAPFAIGRELGEALGIRTAHNHIIVPVNGYSGRSKPGLWQWLAAQSET
jgi:hypothetical protein